MLRPIQSKMYGQNVDNKQDETLACNIIYFPTK